MNHNTKHKALDYFPWVLVLFHSIGIFIFLSPDRIKNLSGLNMLLCATLVFVASTNWKKESKLLLGIIIGGLTVEIIGVNTGWLFGNYQYGNELGLKLWGVPLVLGINWYCIIASTSHLVEHFLEKQSLWIKTFIAAVLAVGLDSVLEPVAIKYDFWIWANNTIPLSNYTCWFLFSLLFIFFYLKNISKVNKTAISLYVIWILFFFTLNIF